MDAVSDRTPSQRPLVHYQTHGARTNPLCHRSQIGCRLGMSVDSDQRRLLVSGAILYCPAKGGNQRWRIVMKGTLSLASAAIIGVMFLAAHANAQGVPQSVEITKVDVQKVAAGYRASKVIGSSVVNEANQTIGKIDDL